MSFENGEDLPRKQEKTPKKLVQVWVDADVVDELREANVDIPALMRKALIDAREKLEE